VGWGNRAGAAGDACAAQQAPDPNARAPVTTAPVRRQAAVSASGVAFGDHDAPSTLLGVAALGYADQLVEVEAVAYVGA